ncbi:HAD family hydrolase [Candidatus Parcubacteria bacterium]|nr:MAG: HAD family hydrolase [Candidatus Parcubacteria bacterium]
MMLDPWHTQEAEETFRVLDTSEKGLSHIEAVRRLKENGPNTLPEAKGESHFAIFIRQFKSPLIYVLFGASLVMLATHETVDGLLILAVLVFNAVIGSIQEGRAQNTLNALKHFVETTATVIRDDKEISIPDTEVVPGDILVLQEGEKIPADARIFLSHSLRIDEAALTGESVPVAKSKDVLPEQNLKTSEQKNMVFKGTYIAAGNGKAIVVSTGVETVIGKIAQEITASVSEIPLQANIRYLSHLIIGVVSAVIVFLFIFGIAVGNTPQQMFGTAVALAVSVIPEGLPIVLTVVLATGVWRMGKRNALVKRLQAVEALGQARVIAVDKTGTLTKNEIIVEKAYLDGTFLDVSGVGYEPVGEVTKDGRKITAEEYAVLAAAARISALTSNARAVYAEEESRWRVSGDPTEAAMLVFAQKLAVHKDELEQELPLLDELPFDSDAKYHAVLHEGKGKHVLSIAGAPEVLLSKCHAIRRSHAATPISEKEKAELEEQFLTMSKQGLRVVALAEKHIPAKTLTKQDVEGLTLVGFLGMKDGIRPEVPEAMRRAIAAGMRVVMITGDHKVTATAIATEAGIYKEGSTVITGVEMDALSDHQLAERIRTVSVFARMTPEHKLRIVQAYKKNGEIIAMTGDGVNDAPSLVAADLGVAMGRIGTEVAKEAADIVLLDDNFGSIVSAVEEGRNMYKAIKRVILYLFSTSMGEVFTIVGALAIGVPLPLLPAQIIWLNFVTDPFLDAALAMEPKEKDLLKGTFEHPKKYLIDKLMVQRMPLMALTMAIGTLALFTLYVADDMAKALTISLTVLAVYQWFNAWNCRSETESVFTMNPFSNKFLILATSLVVCLQLLVVYTPFLQGLFHTTALTLNEWVLVVTVGFSIVIVEEIRKFFFRKWKS